MADVVRGPDFQKARVVDLAANGDTVVTGSCGIHNATGIQGDVRVVFANGELATLFITPGQFIFCALREIRVTGTNVFLQNGGLRALF